MEKIKDERLIMRNLQNIRIVYIVQTIGILGILAHSFFQGGLDEMRANPLWLLFMLTTILSAYLSMRLSVENEQPVQNPAKSFRISLFVSMTISITVSTLTLLTPGFGLSDAFLIGSILFICGFIPIYYIYRLRVKEQEDMEE